MNEAMQWIKFGEWHRSACSRFAFRRYYGSWSGYKDAWLVIRTARSPLGKAWTIVRLRKYAKAWAEVSANGNQWYHNALKNICPECKRVFDMWNSIDEKEWSAGHDCEPAHPQFIDISAFDTAKEINIMNQFERDTILDEAHGKSEQRRTRISNTHARCMGLLAKAIVQTFIGQSNSIDGTRWYEAIRKLHGLIALFDELEAAAAGQADAIESSDLPDDQYKIMQGKREQAENSYAQLQRMREELIHEFQTQLGDAYGVKI